MAAVDSLIHREVSYLFITVPAALNLFEDVEEG